jgi:pimeloyl-ACP methyl ester carboxylesterase
MVKDIVVNGSLLRVDHTIVAIDKPTIVFLHDSLGCIELWRDFPSKVGEAVQCNTLIYDRHGYGKSGSFISVSRNINYLQTEADILHVLMEQCGIDNAILFGHSDGGSIALIAAAKYPASVTGVITEGAHIFVEDITLSGIRQAVLAYQTTNLKERLQKYHGDKTDAVFRAWTETWLAPDFKWWNIESFLPRIVCPVLVIQGEQDEYGSIAQVDGIVRQVRGSAHPFIIPSAGHTPHKEATDIVLECSASFIKNLTT